MKLFICPNNLTEQQAQTARLCVEKLEKRYQCVMSTKNSASLYGNAERAGAPQDCDVVVAVGGDGAVLRASKVAVENDKPLLGVNGGHTGYLCALSANDELDRADLANFSVSQRTLLGFDFNGERFALNDVVLSKENFGSTIDAEIAVNGKKIACWRGDGVIVSTPTGSTSYNLSAGGPIVSEACADFIVTPICAHTVGARAFVVSDRSEVALSYVEKHGGKALVFADGVLLGEAKKPLIVRKYKKLLTLFVG